MDTMIPAMVFGSTVVLIAVWIYASKSKKEDKGSLKSGKEQDD